VNMTLKEYIQKGSGPLTDVFFVAWPRGTGGTLLISLLQ
jgi:hypothetical protein